MFKEPLSHLYRARGRPGRIKKARKPKPYDMTTSDILKVGPIKMFNPMKYAIPPEEWMNKN